MAISRETTERIRDLLKEHPEGLSITGIVSAIPLNRNTISRYLDTMLVSGQVEMHHFGMAKIFTLAKRLPVSSVLSISSEYVLQVDGGLRVIFLNEPFLALLDLSEREVLGKKIDATRLPGIFADEYPLLLRWISEGLSGIERRGEIQLPARERILACRVSPAVFSEGQKGVTVLFEDITAQRNDEDRIRESEEKFRTLAEVATDGILICDADGRVIEWNEALAGITGLEREQVIGSPVPDMILRSLASDSQGEGRVAAMRARLRTATRTGSSQLFFSPVEAVVHPPGGTSRIIRLTIFPVRTSRGTLIGAIVHDITGQRLDEKRLRESEERYRTLVEISPDAILLHQKGVVLYANPAAVRLLGACAPSDLLGRSVLDFVGPAHRGAVQKNIQSDLLGETTPAMELEMVRIDGTQITVEGRGVRTFIDGEPAVQVALQDITGRKRAEAALQESEERLRLALSGSETGLWELDLTTMQGTIDENAAAILGYRTEEIGPGRTAWDDLSHPEDVPLIAKRLTEHLEGKTDVFESEHRMRHASGRWVWVTGRGKVTRRIPGGAPWRISGTLQDITRKKEAEDALRAGEERYRHLLERSFNAVIVHKGGKILIANEAALAMAGAASPQDLIGRDITPFIHPSSRQLVQERIAEMLKSPGTTMPLARETFLRMNGEPFAVDVMATSFLDTDGIAIQIIFREIDRGDLNPSCRADRNVAAQGGSEKTK
jgi:PAS domain S-box-containing protein